MNPLMSTTRTAPSPAPAATATTTKTPAATRTQHGHRRDEEDVTVARLPRVVVIAATAAVALVEATMKQPQPSSQQKWRLLSRCSHISVQDEPNKQFSAAAASSSSSFVGDAKRFPSRQESMQQSALPAPSIVQNTNQRWQTQTRLVGDSTASQQSWVLRRVCSQSKQQQPTTTTNPLQQQQLQSRYGQKDGLFAFLSTRLCLLFLLCLCCSSSSAWVLLPSSTPTRQTNAAPWTPDPPTRHNRPSFSSSSSTTSLLLFGRRSLSHGIGQSWLQLHAKSTASDSDDASSSSSSTNNNNNNKEDSSDKKKSTDRSNNNKAKRKKWYRNYIKSRKKNNSKQNAKASNNVTATSKESETSSTVLSKADLVKAVGESMAQAKKNTQKPLTRIVPPLVVQDVVERGIDNTKDDLDRDGTNAIEDDKDDDNMNNNDKKENLLNRFNPFKAGQNLRKTIDTALTSISSSPTTVARDSMYYLLDDRLSLSSSSRSSSSSSDGSTNPKGSLLFFEDEDDYVPEVLVVCGGSTTTMGGARRRRRQASNDSMTEEDDHGRSDDEDDEEEDLLGPLVVQRLLRGTQGQFRVRVLVPDLYTQTLQRYGTGVTYSQGDLHNMDSLELAVTDVDKIVFCPNTPSRHSRDDDKDDGDDELVSSASSLDEQEKRVKRAEQMDYLGMKNLVRAYQNVRHADYGTSQAAKRTLFKFGSGRRSIDDHALFTVLVDEDDEDVNPDDWMMDDDYDDDEEDEDEDEFASSYGDYDDDDEEDDLYRDGNSISTTTTTAQVQWIRNKFDHAVFLGRLPVVKSPTTATFSSSGGESSQQQQSVPGTQAEAAIMSSRLRSRDSPDEGIDLAKASFGGFILRVCSGGGTYQAFVRTGLYESMGIEYVCDFSTVSKPSSSSLQSWNSDNRNMNNNNKSRNKFTTVRLPFETFRPVRRRSTSAGSAVVDTNVDNGLDDDESEEIPPFSGQDVQHIGFRYQTGSNPLPSGTGDSSLDPASKQRLLLAQSMGRNMEPQQNDMQSFYLAFTYIKLYRSQPEPEFVYVSDARIPPKLPDDRVRHDLKRLLVLKDSTDGGDESSDIMADAGAVLLDDRTTTATLQRTINTEKEAYFKYLGEDTLKKSGLAYAVVRVPTFPSEKDTETASSLREIELAADNHLDNGNSKSNKNGEMLSGDTSSVVTHDQVAQVCVSALLDPNALNKSFYIRQKNQRSNDDTDNKITNTAIDDSNNALSNQFKALPQDPVSI